MSTGLNYQYYDGYFGDVTAPYNNDNLNWFDGRGPNATGTQTGVINYSNNNQSNETFSLRWWGYIIPKVSGTWEFYTSSDDSSRLYIAPRGIMFNNSNQPRHGLNDIRDNNDYYIVQNGGLHGNRARYGSIDLTENVAYEIILYFGENYGGNYIYFRWKPPNYGTSNSAGTFLNSIGGDSYLEFYTDATSTFSFSTEPTLDITITPSFSWGDYLNKSYEDVSGVINIVTTNINGSNIDSPTIVNFADFSNNNVTNNTLFNDFFNNNYGDLFTFDSDLDHINNSNYLGYAGSNPQTYTLAYPDISNSINFFISGTNLGYITLTSKVSGYCKLYYGNVFSQGKTEVLKNDVIISIADSDNSPNHYQRLVEFYIDIGDVIKITEGHYATVCVLYQLIIYQHYITATIDNSSYSSIVVDSSASIIIPQSKIQSLTDKTYNVTFDLSPSDEPQLRRELDSIKMYYFNNGIKYYIANTCDQNGVIDYTTNINDSAEIEISFDVDVGNNFERYDILKVKNRTGDNLNKIWLRFSNPSGEIRFDESVPDSPSVNINDANNNTIFSTKEDNDFLFNYFNQDWYIEFLYNYLPPIIIRSLNTYSNLQVISTNTGDNFILNGDIVTADNKYSLQKGSYTLNVPQSYPTAILNIGKESLISYTGDSSKKTSQIVGGAEEESGTYDFYWGDIVITVNSNFNEVSIGSSYFGYIGGKYLFTYRENIVSENTSVIVKKNPIIIDDISLSWNNYLNSYEDDVSGLIQVNTVNQPITVEFSHFTDIISSNNAITTFNNFFNNIYGDFITFNTSNIDNINSVAYDGHAGNNPQSYATYYPEYPNSISFFKGGSGSGNIGIVSMTFKVRGHCKLYYGNVHGSTGTQYTLVKKNNIEIDRANIGDYQKLVKFNVDIDDIIEISDQDGTVSALYALVFEKSDDLTLTMNRQSTDDIIFNKIKLLKTDPTAGGGYNLEVGELQIWINGVNIAPSLNFTSTYTRSSSTNEYQSTTITINPPEENRSYSSIWNNDPIGQLHARSMLDSEQAWSSGSNSVGEWMQIDIGLLEKVVGVITQGRTDYQDQWVKTYKLQYSIDNVTFYDVDEGKTFTGNINRNSKNANVFDNSVEARYIRFYPQSWNIWMAMRAGILLPTFRLNYIKDEDLTASSVYIATDSTQQTAYTSDPPTKTLQGHPISLESSFATKSFNDLESIVIYGRNNSSAYERLKGSTLQLYYDDIILYNKEINDSLSGLRNIWRFDGPAINNVTNFASDISTTNILSDTYSGLTKYEITLSNEIIYPIVFNEIPNENDTFYIYVYDNSGNKSYIKPTENENYLNFQHGNNDKVGAQMFKLRFRSDGTKYFIAEDGNSFLRFFGRALLESNMTELNNIDGTQLNRNINNIVPYDLSFVLYDIFNYTEDGQDNGLIKTSFYKENIPSFIIPQEILENLTDGSYNIGLSVTDITENSDISNIVFFVDKTPPIITDISFSFGSVININESQNDGIIYINASENISSAQVTLASDTYSSNSIIDNSASVIIPSSKLQSLTDGSYNVLVTVLDVPGNDTSANFVFNVDFTAPIINDVSFSWQNYLNIVEANSSGAIYINTTGVEDGQIITATIVNDNYESSILNDNATITIPQSKLFSLTDGSYNVFITVSDINGNNTSNNTSFIVDKTVPNFNNVTYSWGNYLNINDRDSSGTIYVSTILVEDGQTITANLNGNIYSNTIIDNSASFIIPPSHLSGLSHGSNTITLNVSDLAENNATNNFSFIVDLIPPIINNVSFSSGPILNINESLIDQTVFVNTSLVENNQTITAVIDNSSYSSTVTNNNASITIPSSKLITLINGSYDITVTVSDLAGNSVTDNNTSFEVDVIRPSIDNISFSWAQVLNINESNSSGDVYITTSDIEDGQTITATIESSSYSSTVTNNNASITIPQSKLFNLVNGTYNVIVNVSDFAGNDTSNNATFLVDKTAIINSASFSWGNILNINESEISGNIYITTTGIEDSQTINANIDGSDFSSTIIDNSSIVIIPLSKLQTLVDGSHSVLITSSDVTGNDASFNISFLVDRTAPIIEDVSFSWDPLLNIPKSNISGIIHITTSGVEDNQIAIARFNNYDYTSTVINNNANIGIPSVVLQGLTTGSYSILLSVSDFAGNDISNNYYFNVDKTAPIFENISFSWGDYLNNSESQINGLVTIDTSNVENSQTITATIDNSNYSSTILDNSATIIIPSSKLVNLNDGLYNISFTTTNIIDNTSTTNKSFSVDRTPPVINNIIFSWGNILNINESKNPGTINVSTTGLLNNEIVTATLNNNTFTGSVLNNNTSISIPQSRLDELTDGSYNVVINITDIAGNDASSNSTFIVDKIAPSIDSISFSWGPELSLTESNNVNGGSIFVSTTNIEDFQIITARLNNLDYSANVIANNATISIETAALQVLFDGCYNVIVSVSDFAGNNTDSSNTFIVDKAIPVIAINGANIINHARTSPYIDAGAVARDSKGGDLTNSIVVTSNVNINIIGTYTIQYNVTDSLGNIAQPVTRVVNIVNRYFVDDIERNSLTLLRGYLYSFDLEDPTLSNHPLAFSTDSINQNIIDDNLYQITRNGSQGTPNASLSLIIPYTHTGPLYYFCQNHNGMGGIINVIETNPVTEINKDTPIGPYTITYDVTDYNNNEANTIVRNINVVDTTPPEIFLDGSLNLTLEKGDLYIEPGFTATDFSNIDLTNSVVINSNLDMNTVGTYTILYTVTDEANISVTLSRTINVEDTTKPIITLFGDNPYIQYKDASYNEPGFTVIDYSNVDLSNLIDISSNVDTNTLGNYTIKYNVTDPCGNEAIEKIRNVEVIFGPVDAITDDSINQIVNEWVTEPRQLQFIYPFNIPYYGNIDRWNVSQVTDMSNLFINTNFNDDISNWDVSNVTNMSSMFQNSSFNQDISIWNVSNVTNMSSMFENSSFNQDISIWNLSNVTDPSGTSSMFKDSNFNQDINIWNVLNITNMSSMFENTSFNQDISGWNISNVTNISSMFKNSSFNQNISTWNVSNVTNMNSIFENNSVFNQDIRIWNVDENTTLNNMFLNATDMSLNFSDANGYGDTPTNNFFLRIDVILEPSNIDITEFYNDEITNFVITLPVLDTADDNPASNNVPVIFTIGNENITNFVRTSTGITGTLNLINNTTVGPQEIFISFKLPNAFTVNFIGTIISYYNVECLNFISQTNIINSNGNKYRFNNDTTYHTYFKYGLYDDDTYKIINIPQTHPIAIIGNISYSVDNTEPFIIKVSGGSTTPTNQDYFTFKDISDNTIQIANGSFKFMYGRTYRFADYGIITANPFKLNGNTLFGGSNGNNFIDVNYTTDISYSISHSSSSYNGTLQSLIANINGSTYNFYYGNINLIPNSNFGLASVYCYYHGYMGGENLLTYISKCSTPIITLDGSASVIHEKGLIYDDSGATVSDATGENINDIITVSSDVSDNTVGLYTVIFNATNRGGIVANTVTRTVNVIDTTPPVITLIGDANLNHEKGETYTDAGASAVDLRNIDVTDLIVTTGSVSENVVGNYTITYNVTDVCGNVGIPVYRTINVIDTTPPVITILGTNPINIERGTIYVDGGATALDFPNENISSRIQTSYLNGNNLDVNTIGKYYLNYNVSDLQNNAAQQVTRTINVVDTTKPTIILIGDASMSLQRGIDIYVEQGANVIDSLEVGDENISTNLIITGDVCGNVVGTYEISYNAVDVGNNAADTVYRYVHVFDDQKPVITLNGNISLTLERGYPYVELGATAFDTNGDDLTSNIVIDSTNINIYNEGSYIVTYNVTDVAGNSADQVIRTIIVQDTRPPIITIIGDNPFYHEMGDVFIDPGVIAIDPSNENLTNNVVVSGDDVCGNVIGTYNIYYDVSDVTGLLAPTQQRVVIVQDTVGPLITLNGINPITIERGVNYIDAGAVAYPRSGLLNPVIGPYISGFPAPSNISENVNTNVQGDYEYTYSISDACGNTTTATRNVFVRDTQAPVITLLGSNPLDWDRGRPFIDPGATAIDLIGENLTQNIVATTDICYNVTGTYEISYNIVDLAGNSANIIRTVNIFDSSPPVITLIGNKNMILYHGNEYIEPGATAIDAINNQNLTNDIVISGDVCGNIIGLYTVNYDVSDNANNSTRVTRYVTVTDDYIVDSVIEVEELQGEELWTSYNGISADGTRMVVGFYGDTHYGNIGRGNVLYSHDSGNTWNYSTIDYQTTSLSLRAVCLSKNGIYSIFTNATTNMDVYYSSDGGMTYNVLAKPGISYYQLKSFINESGTIAIVTSYVFTNENGTYNTPLFIGYIDKNNLLNTSWSVVYKNGWDDINKIGANSTFTNIYLGMYNGVWIFNDTDTSKLKNVSDWTQSTNNNIKNIKAKEIESSLDNKVIVIPNGNNSNEVWFSNDYGNNFYNMYNSEINFTQAVSVSPDGNYILIYNSTNLLLYTPGDNGNYTKLGVINNNIFGKSITYCTISNNASMIVSRGSLTLNSSYPPEDDAAWVVNVNSVYDSYKLFQLENIGIASNNHAVIGRDNGNVIYYTNNNGNTWNRSIMPSMPDRNDNYLNYAGDDSTIDGKIRCLTMSRNGRYSGFVNRANPQNERWHSDFYISSDYGASYSRYSGTPDSNFGVNINTNNDTNNQNTGENMLISNDGNTIIVARFGWGYLHIKTSDNQYWTYFNYARNNNNQSTAFWVTSMAGNAELTKVYVTDRRSYTLAIYDANNLSNTTTPTIKQRDNWQLYYVSDTGAIQSSEPTNKGLINHIACSEDGEIVLFGLENGKLHISTNGGTSFSEITDSVFTNNYYWTSVSVSSDGTTMAASTTSTTSPLFIYDNNTWSEYSHIDEILGIGNEFTIRVGSSLNNTKTIDLPYSNMTVGTTPFYIPANDSLQDSTVVSSIYGDTFSVSVTGNQLTVTRTDVTGGWGQNLVLKGTVSINKLAVNNDLILFNNPDSYYIKKDSNGFSSVPQLINVVTEPLPNPIYAWDFRNKSGSSVIIDSIGNKNAYFYQRNGTTNNAKTISSNVGAILNGSTDYIVTDLINYGSSFSIEVYFKPGNESELNNSYKRILAAGPNGEIWTHNDAFLVARDHLINGNAGFYTSTTNGNPRATMDFFGYNTDIHFVVTFNHNTNIVNIQSNSVRNTFSLPNNSLNAGDKKIFLGQDEEFYSSYWMKGTYYLLRVWDRELAKDHIEHLFNVKDIVDHF